jgi:ribonuclease HI
MKRLIEIYTDGAVSGNPGGPGGAAAVIKDYLVEETKVIGKFSNDTTNQRMELQGVIIGLNKVLDDHTVITRGLDFTDIKIYSDSAYFIRAFNEGWLDKWQRNGWKNAKKEPVANQDLWEKILQLKKQLELQGANFHFIKVKGHSDNEYNNIADEIAVFCKERQIDHFNSIKMVEEV